MRPAFNRTASRSDWSSSRRGMGSPVSVPIGGESVHLKASPQPPQTSPRRPIRYNRRPVQPPVVVGVLILTALGGATLAAQEPRSVWSGVYTGAQAARGADLYERTCAECHGPELEGGETAPPLAGPDFRWAWNGLSVGDLFERLRISMPEGRPRSMSRTEKADVLAYMFEQNAFPAGDTELRARTESLRTIRIDAVEP